MDSSRDELNDVGDGSGVRDVRNEQTLVYHALFGGNVVTRETIRADPMNEGPPKEVVGRILGLLQDQPFEHAMAVLGELQVFLMVEEVDDPIKAVNTLADLMRTLVRKMVEAKQGKRVH